MIHIAEKQEDGKTEPKEAEKKRKRRAKKPIEFRTVPRDVTWLVAIDCSLKSPGIVIWNQEKDTYQMFGWAKNRKRYEELAPLNDATVHVYPPFFKAGSKPSMDEQLETVSESIMRVIYEVVAYSTNVVVAFEALPYALDNSSSRVQLGDILALTRHKCFLSGWRLLMVMPPTIKKKWSGYGSAKKPDMLVEYLKRFPVPSTRPLFFQHASNIDPNKITKPSEDLIDAYALAVILRTTTS